MIGSVAIVGLGPGAPELTTSAAEAVIAAATDLVGYGPYLNRIGPITGQRRHISDNRVELERARLALGLASEGRRVAVVSSGDPGIFAMASAVFQAIETGPSPWRALDVSVIPGVSAMLAVAARLGAPLGHDFCVMSLSDNLKPWPLVLRRLDAAAQAGFVLVLYNPRSSARPDQLGEALARLGRILPAATQVAFATAVTQHDERIVHTTLQDADPTTADMRTLVIVGSAQTRLIARPGLAPWLYTPRFAS